QWNVRPEGRTAGCTRKDVERGLTRRGGPRDGVLRIAHSSREAGSGFLAEVDRGGDRQLPGAPILDEDRPRGGPGRGPDTRQESIEDRADVASPCKDVRALDEDIDCRGLGHASPLAVTGAPPRRSLRRGPYRTPSRASGQQSREQGRPSGGPAGAHERTPRDRRSLEIRARDLRPAGRVNHDRHRGRARRGIDDGSPEPDAGLVRGETEVDPTARQRRGGPGMRHGDLLVCFGPIGPIRLRRVVGGLRNRRARVGPRRRSEGRTLPRRAAGFAVASPPSPGRGGRCSSSQGTRLFAAQPPGWTSPDSYARTTACTRSRRPSFMRIRATWL